jgi:hypothetical protein
MRVHHEPRLSGNSASGLMGVMKRHEDPASLS